MSDHVPMETRECGCVIPETIYCAHTPTPQQVDETARAIAHVPGESWTDHQRQAETAWRVVARHLVRSAAVLGITEETHG